ncbi:MAG: hypothetical protein QG621_592, partial [Patescibacteria group bacterium]|nr:hypothetical protein [Patescibacteria group bacterium]
EVHTEKGQWCAKVGDGSLYRAYGPTWAAAVGHLVEAHPAFFYIQIMKT